MKIQIDVEEFKKVCEESSTKLEAYNKLGMHRNTFDKYCKLLGIQKFRSKKIQRRYLLEDILAGKYPNYPTSHLHDRLLSEGYKEHKCECCGLTEWNGQPIPLELHHIDGNHSNHSLENLQFLCPNCHSQTDNFKSKNVKHYKFENIIEE